MLRKEIAGCCFEIICSGAFKLTENFALIQPHFCFNAGFFCGILFFLQFDSGFGSLVNTLLTYLIRTPIYGGNHFGKSVFCFGFAHKN
jgi:hypothetical protein